MKLPEHELYRHLNAPHHQNERESTSYLLWPNTVLARLLTSEEIHLTTRFLKLIRSQSKSSSLSNLQNVLKRVKGGVDPQAESEDLAKKYATYDPDSRSEFLSRLQTFKLVTYSSKPSQIDAVAAARCGWFNEGMSRIDSCLARLNMLYRQRKVDVQNMQSYLDHATQAYI